MDTSESINNKILEERQIEKFSTFIESYEADVSRIRSRLRSSGNSTIQTGTDVPESISIFALTGEEGGGRGFSLLLTTALQTATMVR